MQKTLGIIAIGFCLSLCQLATAATWYVDDSVPSSGDGTTWETAFETIQQGIDAASDGDTVVVAEGTYVENIHFHGKNIILQSTDPQDPDCVANTIIDGNKSRSVVTFSGTEDETCILSGFTMRNGSAEDGGGICGGTEDTWAHATIQNSVINGNSAHGYGGGLAYCDGAIRNNRITGNSAVVHGGGVAYSDGPIENNTIAGNSAEVGGGLCGCNGTIRSTVVSHNSAGLGGGLCWCSGTIENCTITGNSGQHGGGLSECVGGPIRNCIIWRNRAPEDAQIRYSVQPTYSCIQDWTRGGLRNILKDPRFLDMDGPDDDSATYEDNDYRLIADSPCIDAGKNEEWMREAVDLDGNPRISYGTSSRTVDMGAYEFLGTYVWYVDDDAPADPGPGIPTVSDPHEDGTKAHPFDFIQEAIDAAEDRDVIVVADGTYESDGWLNNAVADFRGKAVTLRSENGPEKCILSRGDYVVRFRSGETPASVLSGFTITGADPGGGICCSDSSPTIMNNIITENWSEYGLGAILVHNSSAVIVGNIICRNEVYGECAGIVVCHGSSATITNNTIVGNGSPGHQNNGGVYCTEGGTATITNCIFWGNGEYDLYGCSATFSCLEHAVPGDGNINTDPLFAEPAYWDDRGTPDKRWDDVWVGGDYRLQGDSPCIDAGDNSPLDSLRFDMDGKLRVAFGKKSLTVDMGAYEYNSPAFAVSQVALTEGGCKLIWNSQPLDYYIIWSCDDLLTGEWTPGLAVVTRGKSTVWIAPDTPSPCRFYRIEMR